MAETKLKAVNMCLRGIGLSPTSDVYEDDLDVGNALETVEQVSLNLQSQGMWFNKEYGWKLTPNTITGEISVIGSAISMITSGESQGVDLIQKAGKMYDRVNHTFDLRDLVNKDGKIEFTTINKVPYEDMPLIVRTAVAYIARRQFAQDAEVDERRWKFQKTDESMAIMMMQREDARASKRSYVRDNPYIQSFLANAGGPNSYANNVGVFPKRNT